MAGNTGIPELDDALREVNEATDTTGQDATTDAARSRAGASRKASGSRKATAPASSLSRRITKQVGLIGGVVDRWDQDGVCGNAIMDGAPELGEALETLARENPKVKQFLEGGVEGTAWIGVVFAVAGIVVPIARAHSPRHRANVREWEAEQGRRAAVREELFDIESAETPDDVFGGFAGNGSAVSEGHDDGPSAATISGLPFAR